jgi:hypothetical protein
MANRIDRCRISDCCSIITSNNNSVFLSMEEKVEENIR